jgi:hypothetical protein
VKLGDGLRGLGLLSSAVHGATSMAFTCSNGRAEMASTMVVGSEAGAVFALQPVSLSKVNKDSFDASWDDDARKMLGYVSSDANRESVKSHVERWAKLNSQSHSGKIDPDTLFRY